jgi:MoxR-like ATPase
LSPRAGLNLLHAARAWALLEGRSHVLPEDLQAVLPSVVGHRLQAPGQQGRDSVEIARRLLAEVAIP